MHVQRPRKKIQSVGLYLHLHGTRRKGCADGREKLGELLSQREDPAAASGAFLNLRADAKQAALPSSPFFSLFFLLSRKKRKKGLLCLLFRFNFQTERRRS